MKQISILAAKTSKALLSLAGRGGSLPGTIALKLDADILSSLHFSGPIVLVTGTNGKTSTANMICEMFEKAGYKTISNRKGDNLKAGIVTTLLNAAGLDGKVKADAIVLEVDELNIRHVLPFIPVSALVVNNFFRDQLDRAKEMEVLIESIEKVLPDYAGTLILNGNDPNVVRMADKAPKAHVLYFGIEKNQYSTLENQEASEGKFCPRCSSRLEYEYYQYSHIGKFHCTACDFQTPPLNTALYDINLHTMTFWCNGQEYHDPYQGMYSLYNCAALLCTAAHFHISPECIRQVFASAPQPLGRNESFSAGDKKIVLNLIKNPTGANEVMKVIEQDPDTKAILIVLNDREQDGRDVSWIYDTHFEKLFDDATTAIVCTGMRAYDMALRIHYGGWQGKLLVENDLDAAVKEVLKHGDKVYAIATYTALVPARNAIVKGAAQ